MWGVRYVGRHCGSAHFKIDLSLARSFDSNGQTTSASFTCVDAEVIWCIGQTLLQSMSSGVHLVCSPVGDSSHGELERTP